MSIENLYTVISKSTENPDNLHTKLNIKVAVNSSHPIFSGHFPGQPVLPGVCQVQMIRELVENHFMIKARLQKSDNIKFLGMIVPDKHPEFDFNIQVNHTEPGIYGVNAVISGTDVVFCKFKGKFIGEQSCH